MALKGTDARIPRANDCVARYLTVMAGPVLDQTAQLFTIPRRLAVVHIFATITIWGITRRSYKGGVCPGFLLVYTSW